MTYGRRKLTSGPLRKSLAAWPPPLRAQSVSATEIYCNPAPAIREDIVAFAMTDVTRTRRQFPIAAPRPYASPTSRRRWGDAARPAPAWRMMERGAAAPTAAGESRQFASRPAAASSACRAHRCGHTSGFVTRISSARPTFLQNQPRRATNVDAKPQRRIVNSNGGAATLEPPAQLNKRHGPPFRRGTHVRAASHYAAAAHHRHEAARAHNQGLTTRRRNTSRRRTNIARRRTNSRPKRPNTLKKTK